MKESLRALEEDEETINSLKAKLRWHQRVLDALPHFIFYKDRESNYLGCNQSFAKVAGLNKPEEVSGKTDHDLAWKKEEAEFFRLVDAKVMASGQEEVGIIEPQLQADGKEAWLETSKIPLRDEENNIIGILGFYADITEKRAHEASLQQAKRLEAIGRLAGGVAHDFNNLIGGIMGAAELLKSRTEQSIESRLLAEILLATDRASRLTSQLLSFSRQGQILKKVVNIHDALENVKVLLSRALPTQTQLDVRLESDAPFVLADGAELELALLNLCLNARDSMPQGGNISISTTDEPGNSASSQLGYVKLTVSDDGEGIASEHLPHIFEPFFTTKEAGAGTGLGLASVKGAVENLGGSIQVRSRNPQGTTFTLLMPKTSGRFHSDTQELSASANAPAGKLLLVEDDDLLRATTQEHLQNWGYEVYAASRAEEAWEYFMQHRNELSFALIDIVLPGVPGTALRRNLLAAGADFQILLTSGFPKKNRLDDSDPLPNDGVFFLPKPFTSEELHKSLLRASALHQAKLRAL
ncbi:MAG: ATP-binding protein [Polyangiaceae bacterium]|nr:ATP-binding protein [Polyangiaceae bacterium]